jgi:polysaccharide biosynthesis protein PslH
VTVGCLTSETISAEHRAKLEQLVYKVHVGTLSCNRWLRALASVAKGRSATEAAFFSPQLNATLSDELVAGEYDAAFVFCSSMWPYVTNHLERTRVVVDLVDVDSQKWLDLARQTRGPKSLVYGVEGQRTRRLESSIARHAPIIVASQREAAILQQIAPQAACHVIGNGVDAEYFRPQENAAPDSDVQRCVFVGVQNYEPNVDAIEWFCREVWPGVRAECPFAELDIVGKSPAPRVSSLETMAGVNVTGSVPDVRPYLANASAVIAPLRVARGIQNKVLEAMSMGRAVVASPQALDGIDTAAPPATRASAPSEWIAGILSLFRDPSHRLQLEGAGRDFVIKNFQWDANALKIESLLSEPQ